MKNSKSHQGGLGTIAVIMVLVVLSALAAAITSFSSAQNVASAQDIQSARAWQAAQAGTEWGLFRAMQAPYLCDNQTWNHPDYPDLQVNVVCGQAIYNEGETAPGSPRQVRVVQVIATASGSGGVASHGYVERQRATTAYCDWVGGACTIP